MNKFLTICFLFLAAVAQAQEPNVDQAPQFSTADASDIARYLQRNKDIKTAVDLTQLAWEMTTSFASDEQLTSQWEAALEQPEQTITSFPQLNSHLTAGQFLIQFSDGMNLDSWRLMDLPLMPQFGPNHGPQSASDYFNYYINLPTYWQQLMENMPPNAHWLQFDDFSTLTLKKKKNKQTSQLYRVLLAIQNDEDLANNISSHLWDGPLDPIQVALLRAQFHTRQQQWLALFYDWVELYQLFENNTQLLSSDQQKLLQQVITHTRNTWLENKITIDQIDARIHPVMQLILNQIPEKFKNPDHFNETLNLLIFDLVWEMDQAADYANHALRQDIKNNLEICLNLSADQSPKPQPAMAKKQFQSCVNDFSNWGTQRASQSALAGKTVRLDGALTLSRALELPPFQIINILAMSAATNDNCAQSLSTQVNPVEWTLASESMAWLHDRWPGLMAEWADKNLLDSLYKSGQKINRYPACFDATETLIHQYETVKSQWQKLKAAIHDQLNIYRETHLTPNSQIDFFQPVNQFTQLPADDVMIAPCDVANACGAFVELPATTALLDLFPNHLKMAQQFGLGELKLCYEQVTWQNRQTEPTHLNNNSIANYTGQLSMQLTGQYNEETVFTKVITGESRHLYLFGENTEEVMDMACPLPIVGQQINTQLERGTFGLFPNRLTFLTAQRTNINTVIQKNWAEGELWQNKLADENHSQFITFDEKNDNIAAVNQAFLKHNNAAQQQIYRKLMYPNAARINDSALSLATFEYLTAREMLLKSTQALFPTQYLESSIRSALTGTDRLADADFFKNAFDKQLNLLDMLNKGDALFHQHKDFGSTVPTTPATNNLSNTQQQLLQVIQFSP